jgi:hypothetical protein
MAAGLLRLHSSDALAQLGIASNLQNIQLRICLELLSRKSSYRDEPVENPNMRNVQLRSSLGSCSIGGNTLDMLGCTLPLFQRMMYHAMATYGSHTVVWMGAAGGSELINTAAKFHALGGKAAELNFVAFELQYCNELRANVQKILESSSPVSLGIHNLFS